MPRLWTQTIESHRRDVREAILATTASLLDEVGLRAVTMSRIASDVGIGRATLYKYFADVESILIAWHELQVGEHLEHLSAVRDAAAEDERLEAVLRTYALMLYKSHGSELRAIVHHDHAADAAQAELLRVIGDVLTEDVRRGRVRSDASTTELAKYCIHALGAAGELGSERAVGRLVQIVISGLAAP